MRKVAAGAAKERRAVVLVFGESGNDTKAIRHLMEGLLPDLAGRVERRRQPLVLIKNATEEKARDTRVGSPGLPALARQGA